MNIQYIEEDQYVAREKYREYRAALKVERNKQISYLATIYWQLARGRKVIDAISAISSAGLNPQGHPKLAIAKANEKEANFHRNVSEAVYYHNPRAPILKFALPGRWPGEWLRIKAPVPIIPPSEIPPDANLANLHILWEVEKWEPVAAADPLLLRQLDGPFFVVLAAWNLTKAEQAVMTAGLRM
jgi:hypothetical protein